MNEPERFVDCQPLELNDGDIVAFVGVKNTDVVWLETRTDMVGFTVPESRALYQWLGKVLPEEKP